MTKYFRTDTINVYASKFGRLLSARPAESTILPNGVFCHVGAKEDGSEMIRVMENPSATKSLGIVITPEVNYAEYTRTDARLGVFRNKAGKALRVIPVVEGDALSMSADYFATALTTKGSALEEGDVLSIVENLTAGGQLDYVSDESTIAAGSLYFKITKIFDDHIQNYVFSDENGAIGAYKMYDIEVYLA